MIFSYVLFPVNMENGSKQKKNFHQVARTPIARVSYQLARAVYCIIVTG